VEDGNMAFSYGEKNTVIENRKAFLQKLKIPKERSIFLELMHGTKIVEVNQTLAGTGFNTCELAIKADAIFTKEKDLALIILTGDCIPAIFFDGSNQLLGVVHLSRHNTQKAFVQIVVSYLKREHKTHLQELMVFFAPSILKNSYILPDHPEGFDLVGENFDQLRLKGVKEENIYIGNVDVAKDKEFFSHYRAVRDKSPEGRSATIVMLV